jgi:hypothetical protein
MNSILRTRARVGVAALAIVSSLGACNSHPLVSRRPQVDVVNPASDGGNAGITLDGGGPEVRLDEDLRAPDVSNATEVQSEQKDLAADRVEAASEVPDVGVTTGLELLSWAQSVGGMPIRVLKQSHYVYLGDWANLARFDLDPSSQSGSIQSYEVVDPLQPVRLSTLFTSGQEMQDMAIARRWLFAANDAFGIRLVDIARPESLQSVTNRARTSSSGASLFATAVAVTTRATMEVRQDYVFVGYLYGGGLDIHLVPDGGPLPTPIHYSSTALPSRCDVHQIQIQGDRAYLLTSNGENQMFVEILDLSPLPALPTVLGRVSLPMAIHGGIGDLRLSGDMLYFSASHFAGASSHAGGLRIINVADATNPVLVGSLDLSPSGNVPWKGTGLAVAGNRAFYLASAGVQIIDVSTPASPTARALVPFPSAFGTCLGGTAVMDDDLLYVGATCEPPSGQGGLAIYRRR